MKKDIENREDLFRLMETFYGRLLSDPSISYLFTDVAKIDLHHHLPVLVNFWDMVLFGSDVYRNNTMQIHASLHQKSALNKEHFKTWLGYFNQTIDEIFEGEKTELAKQRAISVANLMQIKIAKEGERTVRQAHDDTTQH
jgi:hemoglobin